MTTKTGIQDQQGLLVSENELSEVYEVLFFHAASRLPLDKKWIKEVEKKLANSVSLFRKEKVACSRELLSYLRYGSFSDEYFVDLIGEVLLLDNSNTIFRGNTLDIPYFIEMMGIIYAIGLITHSSKWIQLGSDMLASLLCLLDGQNKIPFYLASQFDLIDIKSLRALYQTVLNSIYKKTQLVALESLIETQTHELSGYFKGIVDAISTFCDTDTYIPKMDLYKNLDVGIVNLSTPEDSVFLNFCGVGTSIGYLQLSGVEIRAFGFQSGPLGDLSTFGKFRSSTGPKFDVKVAENDSTASCEGWVRLLDKSSSEDLAVPGKVFAKVRLEKEASSKLSIFADLIGHDLADPLLFVFFIKADRAIVNEKFEIPRKTLLSKKNIKGKVAFFSEKGMLQISVNNARLIPLEGEKSFWEADYLLADKIELEKNLWIIETNN